MRKCKHTFEHTACHIIIDREAALPSEMSVPIVARGAFPEPFSMSLPMRVDFLELTAGLFFQSMALGLSPTFPHWGDDRQLITD